MIVRRYARPREKTRKPCMRRRLGLAPKRMKHPVKIRAAEQAAFSVLQCFLANRYCG